MHLSRILSSVLSLAVQKSRREPGICQHYIFFAGDSSAADVTNKLSMQQTYLCRLILIFVD